jgi:hypothetical protein
MLDKVKGAKREADLVMLGADAAEKPLARRTVRSQNFLLEWFEASQAVSVAFACSEESMVMLFDGAATISGEGRRASAPRRSLTVVPAGSYTVALGAAGRGCIVTTNRTDTPSDPLNAASYATPDPRVAPIGSAWPRTGDPDAIRVFEIDAIAAPADNPRLKMLQSATMSINWVDYDGARDRTALSPHSHRDFEQGSLAVAGGFVHHLRVEWGKNANEWREDEHKQAGSPSILIIPPELIHTTEGVGPGHHLLIDLFAPPRRDFIARNWVLNSGDYRDPGKRP